MLNQWIKAQRIGLAAYRLSSPTPLSSEEVEVLRSIRVFLAAELESGQTALPTFVNNLPPATLSLLIAIPQGRLGPLAGLRSVWEQALNRQTGHGGDTDTMPLVVGAQVVAHHILYGTGKPISIFRLARSVFNHQVWRNYERSEKALNTLSQALEILRSPWADTQDRVAVLEKLSEELSDSINSWPHVRNVLYHQMFLWPLLISGGQGISLPVSMDVHFDGRGRVVIPEEDIAAKWRQSLHNAVKAARVLWRSKHGNFGEFRDEVVTASIIYDFNLVKKIAEGFPEQISLIDSSMEAYFSQVILSRLLGNPTSNSNIVTGSIGSQRQKDGEMLADFEFLWPEGVAEKLAYVFRTQFFERIILPHWDDLPDDDPQRSELNAIFDSSCDKQSTELNFVKHLQHVADSFQVGGWRQFRYVRCPDVAWRIHPSGQRLPKQEAIGVQACLEALKDNQSAILKMPDWITPTDLAGALWHVNITLREQIPLLQRPPMISWAFVRAIPEEQDTRFWHVIWRLTGAAPEDFGIFHRTATTDTAAHSLAGALNCFSPRHYCPSHRAPDILVVIGTKHLSASLKEAKNPSLRSHAFDRVLDQLKKPGLLSPNPYIEMRRFLGNTRLVIFESDSFGDTETTEPPFDKHEQKSPEDSSKRLLGKVEQNLLDCLSVFRFGFTQQMASLLWKNAGYDEQPVRNLLKKFERLGYLRYGFGEYHLPGKVGQTLPPSSDRKKDAKKHYAAGIALAPYLSFSKVPGLAFNEAFFPVYVHEAEYHLREAFRLLDIKREDSFRGVVGRALNRLLRFAEYPGWNSVSQLLKAGSLSKEACEIAMDLLEARKHSEAPPHPVHLVTAASATEQRWRQLRNDPHHQDEAERMLQQIIELFAEAELACEYSAFLPEIGYNRIKVLSHRATFLLSNGQVLQQNGMQDKLERDTKEILRLIEDVKDGSTAWGGWYESAGDQLSRHIDAERFYKLGVDWTPQWYQLWIKLIGCADLAYSSKAKVEAILQSLPEEKIDTILQKSLAGIHRLKGMPPTWVQQRWIAGIKRLSQIYNAHPDISRHFAQYQKEFRRWQ